MLGKLIELRNQEFAEENNFKNSYTKRLEHLANRDAIEDEIAKILKLFNLKKDK